MKTQNQGKDWNDRWLEQIALWEVQVEMLMALIDLAKAQIKHDPPE